MQYSKVLYFGLLVTYLLTQPLTKWFRGNSVDRARNELVCSELLASLFSSLAPALSYLDEVRRHSDDGDGQRRAQQRTQAIKEGGERVAALGVVVATQVVPPQGRAEGVEAHAQDIAGV